MSAAKRLVSKEERQQYKDQLAQAYREINYGMRGPLLRAPKQEAVFNHAFTKKQRPKTPLTLEQVAKRREVIKRMEDNLSQTRVDRLWRATLTSAWNKATFGDSGSSSGERVINSIGVVLLPITFILYALTHFHKIRKVFSRKPKN